MKMAGERLGMGEKSVSYWDLHIREDIRHGQWMLDDVALPLIETYSDRAWDMVKGYDQQKFISSRSTSAIVESIRQLEFSWELLQFFLVYCLHKFEIDDR